MKRFTTLAAIAASGCMALATPSLAQSRQDDARFDAAQRRFQSELSIFQQEFDRYQQARNNRGGGGGYYDQRPQGQPYYQDDRDEGGYDPSRYYRPSTQERVLSSDDRVYRGTDGRYYCKRSDGTTGLIVGAVGGGVLGNVIDGGHSRAVGTILGGVLGAVAGQAIERNANKDVRCR